MSNTKLELLLMLICGFILGHGISKFRFEKKETITQQANTTQALSTVQNRVEAIQDVNSSYTEKFFNKKGVLVHEVEKKQENRASDLSFTNHIELKNNKLVVTSATRSTIEERSESTWLLGFSVPLKVHPDFQDMDAQLGYRLLGPIYVTARTDYRFTEPRVGFLINF